MTKLQTVDFQVGADREDEILEKLQIALSHLTIRSRYTSRRYLNKFHIPYQG